MSTDPRIKRLLALAERAPGCPDFGCNVCHEQRETITNARLVLEEQERMLESLRAQVAELRKERDALRKHSSALIGAGAALSNIAYELTQGPDDETAGVKRARIVWEEVVREARKALKP